MEAEILHELHNRFKPHNGQIKGLQPFFKGDKRLDILFLQCGRKFGKTALYIYAAARLTLTKPESEVFIVGPTSEGIKKILWNNRRLHKIIGWKNIRRSVGGPGSGSCLLELHNGSIITIMGSENFEAANGLDPDLVIYDEFKAFHTQFHETMEPNRQAKGAPLIIVGTPPQLDAKNRKEYLQIAKEVREDDLCHFMKMTSFENPHASSHEDLLKTKKRLFDRGEEYIWYREYEAEIVNVGKNMIFGMINRDKHVYKYYDLLNEVKRDQPALEYFIVHDPGTASCHAVLIGCINLYTKDIYLLDEIYESNQANTSVSKIIPKVIEKAKLIYNTNLNSTWVKVYDEAESWFRVEVKNQFGLNYIPTVKKRRNKEDGLSLIKDTLIFNKLKISDKCVNLFEEMEQYCTDDNGKLPNKYDHLIDCLRYMLSAAYYTFNPEERQKKKKINEFKQKRGFSLESDINIQRDESTLWSEFEGEFFNDDYSF